MGKFDRVFPTDEWGCKGNPYYNPEDCDLTLIQVIDFSDMSYEYDTIIVVQDNATGAIFMAQDSGCSCPTPFEQYHSLLEMDRIKTIEQYDKFIEKFENSWSKYPRNEVREGRKKLKDIGLTTLAQRKDNKSQ